MQQRALICLGLLAATGLAWAQEATRDYVDPGQAFAIRAPADWSANRSPLGDSGWNTEFAGPNGAKFGVMSFAAPNGVDPANLEQVAELLMEAILGELEQSGQVDAGEATRTKFGALDAVRRDVTFESDEGAQAGYLLVVLGKRNVFLTYVSAPGDAAADRKTCESSLATLALEATTPNAGGAGGGASLLTNSALAAAAQAIKGGLKREEADAVLVAGDPALTYASVVNFVQILSFAYDIELTETEFGMVRQRFVDCYPQLDAGGKQILAQGGASILAGLSQNPEERAAQKADIRDQTLPVLQRQAQQGLEYAAALWEAIQRRSTTVAAAQAGKPAFAEKGEFDSEMSEADLEASLEMLYFMWVAAGRDPSLVTAETVATVRVALVQNFAAFPAEVQYILANAQRIYSGMRGQWEQADDGTRAQLAAGYGQTLDAIGLGVPQAGGGGGGGAWDDVKPEDMSTIRAEAMANSAFLATNSWYNTSH